MKSLLSIVVPTYNRAKLLERCINSIDLKLNNIEIVIVDDGSFDNVKKRLKNYSKKIKIFRIKNSGRTFALFYGIKKATAKYLLIMDDDDYFIKDKLRMVLQSLKKKENLQKNINCYVFGTIIKKENRIFRSIPQDKISNFISLRADDKIKSDLKEIVNTKLLQNVIKKIKIRKFERVPTGLLWAILSEKYKCKSIREPLVVKKYYADGITKKINYLKFKNPKYMYLLYKIYSNSQSYKSIFFRLKSYINLSRYSFHMKNKKIFYIFDIFGYLVFLYDCILIKLNEKKNKNTTYN